MGFTQQLMDAAEDQLDWDQYAALPLPDRHWPLPGNFDPAENDNVNEAATRKAKPAEQGANGEGAPQMSGQTGGTSAIQQQGDHQHLPVSTAGGTWGPVSRF